MADKHYDIGYLEGTASVLKNLKEYSYNPFTTIGQGQILDIGCGTGADAINLASLAGPGVKVTGIDHDPLMIGKAKDSAAGIENIEFILSEVYPLPFKEAAVDGVRTERLIQHLKEPQMTIDDVYRVLKPGSPFVITETDWANLSFYNTESIIEKKVSYYLTEKKINNGWAARQLTTYLERAGFNHIKLEIFPFVLRSLNEIFTYLLIDQSLAEMSNLGYLGTEEADALHESLKRADQNNYFACSINLVVASALK